MEISIISTPDVSEGSLWRELTLGLDPTLLYVALTLILVALTLRWEYRAARLEPHACPSSLWWRIALGKSSASLAFLLFFVTQVATTPGAELCSDPRWLGAALVASAVGDVALIGRSDRAFLIGLGSFLLAHLAFAVAFLEFAPESALSAQVERGSLSLTSACALLITGGASGFAYRRFRPEITPELRTPSAIYTGVIAVMVATAAAHAYHARCLPVAIGAVAFWLSDLAVAQQRFYGARLELGGFWVRLWGLPLYYSAQLIFILELAP